MQSSIWLGEGKHNDGGVRHGTTYNSTLGGTQPGWMGAMSVPMTEALGCLSAKSLSPVRVGMNA